MIRPAIALDIDGTISSHPQFYLQLTEAWLNNKGTVHIITARHPEEESRTMQELEDWGFGPFLSDKHFHVHHFPDVYEYPWPSPDYEHDMTNQHAQWKANLCKSLGVTALFDDALKNVLACGDAGVYGLYVGQFGPLGRH